MAHYNYSTTKYNQEHMARAVARDVSVSTRQSIEICNFIRNRSLVNAREGLRQTVEMKKPIEFKRFNADVGHKKSIGPGRYPVKACKEFISLMDSVEANAQFKGLNTGSLVISHACAHMAARPMRYGRHHGRQMKRTNIEIVVEEKAEEKKVEKKVEEKKKESAEVKEKAAEPKKTVVAKVERKEGAKLVEQKKEVERKVEIKKPVEQGKQEIRKEQLKQKPEQKKEVKQEVKK